jgi:hypothetical protein
MEVSEGNSYKVHIKECKRKYLPLKSLTLEEGQFIEDKWHHAILTYLDLVPTKEERYNNKILNMEEIIDIKNFYGIEPSKKYLNFIKITKV